MLKIIFPSLTLLPLTWLSKEKKKTWTNVTSYSFLISLISLKLLLHNQNYQNYSTTFFSDPLSTPLIILTTWLLPLMLMATQNHMKKEKTMYQKTYISMLISLQVLLILTFSMNELILFYILFEYKIMS